jgi:hypothetical protein
MKDKQINEAIATACGWDHKPINCGGADFCNDLNAMHEAEASLANDPDQWWLFVEWLTDICVAGVALCISATARQRAEAFLKTLGKWEEAE